MSFNVKHGVMQYVHWWSVSRYMSRRYVSIDTFIVIGIAQAPGGMYELSVPVSPFLFIDKKIYHMQWNMLSSALYQKMIASQAHQIADQFLWHHT